MHMSTARPAITAQSFERLFTLRSAGTVAGPKENFSTARLQPLYTEDSRPDWCVMVLRAVDHNELGDRLRRAIDGLPDTEREVLFFRDVKNLDSADAAWILNISSRTVERLLSRARTEMRRMLAGGSFEVAKNENLARSAA